MILEEFSGIHHLLLTFPAGLNCSLLSHKCSLCICVYPLFTLFPVFSLMWSVSLPSPPSGRLLEIFVFEALKRILLSLLYVIHIRMPILLFPSFVRFVLQGSYFQSSRYVLLSVLYLPIHFLALRRTSATCNLVSSPTWCPVPAPYARTGRSA